MQENNDNLLEIKPHPLFLYPVLNLVLKNSSFKSLLSIRQVCKLWKAESTRFVHQKSKIVLSGRNNKDYLDDFLKTISNSDDNFPSTTFIFKDFDLNTFWNQENEILLTTFQHNIKTVELKCCLWRSSVLRQLVFQHLPNLQILLLDMDYEDLENGNWNNNNNSLPILPMSFGIQHNFINMLKSVHLIGDFSRQADVIFDILKYSPNLQLIHMNKVSQTQDDLFGIWLFEIILSLNFQNLTSLEIDCCIIPIQVETLLSPEVTMMRLKRLSLNLTQIGHSAVFNILKKFRTLESCEFQLENASTDLIYKISKVYPKSKAWVVIHSNPISKFTFPLRYPIVKVD